MAKKTKRSEPLTEAQKAERKVKREQEARERFRKLAPKRVTKLINVARQLALCAGVGYAYTDSEKEQLLAAVDKARITVHAAFDITEVKKDEFKFTESRSGGCPVSGG